jgi:hypothetical protein
MRGLPGHNVIAFDQAAGRIRCAGWEPVSPADLDRAAGDNGDPHSRAFIRRAMSRDTAAIFGCDRVAVLPGWRHSAGAVAEVALSCVLAMPAMDAITLHDITLDVREWWSSITGRQQ